MSNWQISAQKLLSNITGALVRDHMQFDFGRQTKPNALSVIVDNGDRLSLLADMREKLPAAFCPDIYEMAMNDMDVKAIIESDRHIYLWWD